MGLQSVAEIQERFREIRTLGERFLVQANRILILTRLLEQQAGVVEQLRRAFACFDELGLQIESLVQILTFDGERGQTAERVD